MKRLLFVLVVVLVSLACTTSVTPTPGPVTGEPPTEESTSTSPGEEEGENLPLISTPTAITSPSEARNAIVLIVSHGTFVDPDEGWQVNSEWRGSGFIMDSSGHIGTNNHVVQGAARWDVYLDGEDKPREGRLIAASECSDLAVIKIEGEDFPYFEWYTDPDPITEGTPVFVGGFPRGDPGYRLKDGTINGLLEDIPTVWAYVANNYQYSIQLVGGVSGAPVIDADAKVVAVHYAASTLEDDASFGISSEVAQPLLEELQKGKNIDSIGINGRAEILNFGEQQFSGIWISSVNSGSPADQAGIRAGDLIHQMEGLVLATDGTMKDYCTIIRTHDEPTDVMSFTVLRFATNEILDGRINSNPPFPLEFVGNIGPGGTPTDTPTPTSGPEDTPTDTPTPTQGPGDTPTSTVPEYIARDLQALGKDPQSGQVIEENRGPITMKLENHDGHWWVTHDLQNDLTDFVLHATVEWGDADDHCQVKIHGNQRGDYEVSMDPRTGKIRTAKTQDGVWAELPLSHQVEISSDTSNDLVLVINSDTYKVYANGLQNPGTFTDNTHSNGSLLLAAWSPEGSNADGNSSCTFKDVWVWGPNN